MDKKHIIKKTEQFVRKRMKDDTSGHDWWHIERVARMVLYLSKKENADPFVSNLAALLHDVDDWKLNREGNSAANWLNKLKLNEEDKDHILEILREISFKGAKVKSKLHTIEGQVVWDADKLDAIGAMGIARVFAYGGAFGFKIHDPKIKPVMHKTFESYQKSHDTKYNTAISHFYEKLLILKDKMFTKTARRIAEERHKFLETFLEQFHKEWNGKV